MSSVDQVLAAARSQLGVPYVFGAADPNTAFDCSGLTAYAYASAGISLPHKASEQQKMTVAVTEPRPGDLVFWGDPAYHVAIYIGNGRVIAAPRSGSSVRVQNLWGAPTFGRLPALNTGALGTALGSLTSAVKSTPAGLADSAVSGARGIAIKAGAGLLGAGLLGAGLYIAVRTAPRARA